MMSGNEQACSRKDGGNSLLVGRVVRVTASSSELEACTGRGGSFVLAQTERLRTLRK